MRQKKTAVRMQVGLFINYNGKIFSSKEAFFAINRAMSYGDGLFETIRIHNGEILFFDDHYDRMIRGMKALKMIVPDHFSPFYFHKQILDLALKEKIAGNARIRITIFRSGTGLYEPLSASPEYYIRITPMQKGFEWKEELCELGIFRDVPKNYSSISFFKSLNALPYVMAAIFRKEQQYGDCLLMNSFGKVADAISSNIFWIQNKTIYTPPLTDGGVEGVMQKNLIQLFNNHQIPIQEKSVLPEALFDADEIFITNTGWGIKPVTKFGDKILSKRQTKEAFQLLSDQLLK